MENNTLTKRKLYTGLIALTGLIVTIKLAIIYFQSNFNPYALSSFCSINSYVDCDGVAQTTASQFLGIPLAYWGMGFYIFILLLLFSDKLQKIKGLGILSVFKRPMEYISVLGLISFFISVFLAFESVFILHKICLLCIVTYILNTFIALVSTDFENGGFITSIKHSVEDFIAGVKTYPLQLLAVVVLGICFLTYATMANPFTPQVKSKKSISKYLEMKTNPYSVSGNHLGNPDSERKIELYTDFNCKICFAYSIMLHKAVREIGDIYIIPHNLPLDKECNKYLGKQIHKNACRYAKYAVAAKNQNNYWGMTTLLYETQPQTDNEAIDLAQKLNLDIDKFKSDIKSSQTSKEIRQDINYAVEQGVISTPTIIVDGKRYVGMKPYYELVEILSNKKS